MLALGGVDLTSSAGRMTMRVINNVAQFERDLLIERAQSSLARAKSNGKTLGHPKVLSETQRKEVVEQLQEGTGVNLHVAGKKIEGKLNFLSSTKA